MGLGTSPPTKLQTTAMRHADLTQPMANLSREQKFKLLFHGPLTE